MKKGTAGFMIVVTIVGSFILLGYLISICLQLNERLDTVKADLNRCTGQVAALQQRIAERDKAIEELNRRVEEARAEAAKWQKRAAEAAPPHAILFALFGVSTLGAYALGRHNG